MAKNLERIGIKIIFIFIFLPLDDEKFIDSIKNSIRKESKCEILDVKSKNFTSDFLKTINETAHIVFHIFAGLNYNINKNLKNIIIYLKRHASKSSDVKLVIDFYDVAFAHKAAENNNKEEKQNKYEDYRLNISTEDNARLQIELYEMSDGLAARDLQWWVFRRCQGLTKINSCFAPDLPGREIRKNSRTEYTKNIKIIQGGNVPTPAKGSAQSMYFIVNSLLQKGVNISFILPLHYRRRNWPKSKILSQWSDILSLSKERGDITLEASILDSEKLASRLSDADFGIHGVDGYVGTGVPQIARDKPLVALFCAGRLADYAEAGLPILGLEGLRLSKRVLREHTSWVDLEHILEMAAKGENIRNYLADERKRHEEATFKNAEAQRMLMARRLSHFYSSLFPEKIDSSSHTQ